MPMCSSCLKPRVTASAIFSPCRSKSALVATVVPIRIQPIREESSGSSRGKAFPVSCWKYKQFMSVSHHLSISFSLSLSHLLQYAADALCGSVSVVLRVMREELHHSLSTVRQSSKDISEGSTTVDGETELSLHVSHATLNKQIEWGQERLSDTMFHRTECSFFLQGDDACDLNHSNNSRNLLHDFN